MTFYRNVSFVQKNCHRKRSSNFPLSPTICIFIPIYLYSDRLISMNICNNNNNNKKIWFRIKFSLISILFTKLKTLREVAILPSLCRHTKILMNVLILYKKIVFLFYSSQSAKYEVLLCAKKTTIFKKCPASQNIEFGLLYMIYNLSSIVTKVIFLPCFSLNFFSHVFPNNVKQRKLAKAFSWKAPNIDLKIIVF